MTLIAINNGTIDGNRSAGNVEGRLLGIRWAPQAAQLVLMARGVKGRGRRMIAHSTRKVDEGEAGEATLLLTRTEAADLVRIAVDVEEVAVGVSVVASSSRGAVTGTSRVVIIMFLANLLLKT